MNGKSSGKRAEIVLRPSDIRFTQDTISHKFSDGTLIGRLLDDIVIGRCFVSAIKTIEVKLVDGLWYSADNRRLWVFKQLEILGHCPLITVKVVKRIHWGKCTSGNGGTSVSIRGGQPGGIWFSAAEEIRQKLSNDSSVSTEQSVKTKLAKSKLSSSKTDATTSSKCPVFQQNELQRVRRNPLHVNSVKKNVRNSDTNASLQVKKAKRKRRGKNTETTKKEMTKIDEISSGASGAKAARENVENAQQMKNENDPNDNSSEAIGKKRKRGKKKKMRQNAKTVQLAESREFGTTFGQVQNDNKICTYTPREMVTGIDPFAARSNTKEMVVVHNHTRAVDQRRPFKIRYLDDSQYSATSANDYDDEAGDYSGDLHQCNDESMDEYEFDINDYFDSDDEFCNDPYNTWSSSNAFTKKGLNDKRSNEDFIFDTDNIGGNTEPYEKEPQTFYPEMDDNGEIFWKRPPSVTEMMSSDLVHNRLSSARSVGLDEHFLPSKENHFEAATGTLFDDLDKEGRVLKSPVMPVYENPWQSNKILFKKMSSGMDIDNEAERETNAQLGVSHEQ